MNFSCYMLVRLPKLFTMSWNYKNQDLIKLDPKNLVWFFSSLIIKYFFKAMDQLDHVMSVIAITACKVIQTVSDKIDFW